MKFLGIFLLYFLQVIFKPVSGAELTTKTYWDGLTSSLDYMYRGSYLQFYAKNNLYYIGAGAPLLAYSFTEDKRITQNQMTKKIPKYMQLVSDLAPALSFPVVQFTFYTYGVKNEQMKAVEFAKESMATMYLALIESAGLSLIDIHERPKKDKLSKWETNFRGHSSFPSGHVIPYSALTLKTLQFYGPYYASIPFSLFIVASLQRIRDGKHYLSDTVGAFFLTAFASEGVRKAGRNHETSALYRDMLEHEYQLGATVYDGVIGPRISFTW